MAGSRAENHAAQWLTSTKDWKVIEQNWRRPGCEIDLIMKDGDMLHFIEVKYRSSTGSGSGFDYITHAKQKKLVRGVRLWQQENSQTQVQIDVVYVDANYNCTLIENAVIVDQSI